MHSTIRDVALHNGLSFKVYPVSWRMEPHSHSVLSSDALLRGYSNVLTGWQLLDGMERDRRDGSKACSLLLYLFCYTVGPWSKVLLGRISHSVSLQKEVVAEPLWAKKTNPCHNNCQNHFQMLPFPKLK